MKKKRILALGMAAAMAFALASCGSSSSESGSGTADSGESADVINIGVMGPYTGDVAQYGLSVRNGVELYIEQVNEAGGINGKQINLIEEDEKGDATEAVNAYQKMVEQGITGLIGDVTSTPCIAVAQISVEDNMPMITPSATAADVVSFGDNCFQTTISDPYQGTTMAQYAAEKLGIKTVGTVFNSGDDYSTGCNDAFVEECANVGITVTSEQGYAQGDTDFKALISTLISEGVDAIYCPNYYSDIGKIVTQARELGYEGIFIGVDGWSSVENYASAEDLANCYYCCSFATALTSDNVQSFIQAYNDKYGEDPANFEALGYDAAMQMCAALQAAEDAGLEPGSDEYKATMIDTIANQEIEGVTGTIRYEGTGTPVKALRILTFDNGALSYIEDFEPTT